MRTPSRDRRAIVAESQITLHNKERALAGHAAAASADVAERARRGADERPFAARLTARQDGEAAEKQRQRQERDVAGSGPEWLLRQCAERHPLERRDQH